MRRVILIFIIFLPPLLKCWCYRLFFGWRIGRNVQIGLSYIDSREVILDDNVRIGHGNIIRGLNQLTIGKGTYLANFNEIFGGRGYLGWPARLSIGEAVNFMSHHFVDVGGTVEIGDQVTVGGRDTHFWSHTCAITDDGPTLLPTAICVGTEVYIGARSTLVGCSIPDGAVIGAGAVVTKSFLAENERILLAGNPASIKKRYPAK